MRNRLAHWIRDLVGRRGVERELDEELRLHIELETNQYIDAGHAPAEAARRARAEFGAVEAVKDESRADLLPGLRAPARCGRQLQRTRRGLPDGTVVPYTHR